MTFYLRCAYNENEFIINFSIMAKERKKVVWDADLEIAQMMEDVKDNRYIKTNSQLLTNLVYEEHKRIFKKK